MLINSDAPADKPETQQMKVIHRVMRREFTLLPELIAAVPAGNTTRARLLCDHLYLVLGLLHEHHEAEDELLWPILIERLPLQRDLIMAMEKEHHAIAEGVDAAKTKASDWAAQAEPAARDRLAGCLQELGSALNGHLDHEESAVLPLIHEHLTVPEWVAPQKHAMKHGPKTLNGKLTLAGMVLEDATEPERAWFLHEMPAPARLLWRAKGAKQYEARMRQVRAGVAYTA